jgi:3-dehydroquinate dehydratase-2
VHRRWQIALHASTSQGVCGDVLKQGSGASHAKNPLGTRRQFDLPREADPAIYGSTTPAELDAMLQAHAHAKGYELTIYYTNVEGDAINHIYAAAERGIDGLVMNPAGFTYAGYALKDCVKGVGFPYVEVHISHLAKRQIHCVLSDVSDGVIFGFGLYGYILGLEAMLHLLADKEKDEG